MAIIIAFLMDLSINDRILMFANRHYHYINLCKLKKLAVKYQGIWSRSMLRD